MSRFFALQLWMFVLCNLMSTFNEESDDIKKFRSWFSSNGGWIHQDIYFPIESSGLTGRVCRALQSDVVVSSCPFSLAITLDTIQSSLDSLCNLSSERSSVLSPKQRICAYIGLHYIVPEVEDEKRLSRHRPYINVLPKAENMFTPMTFSDTELEIFKGTNLFGAIIDKRNTWRDEHRQLLDLLNESAPNIAKKFTLDMYKLADTYISSRAFPSTLLSREPSLVASPESYPVLLPGLDFFNHKRGQPVSWGISLVERPISPILSDFSASNPTDAELCVSLTINTPISEGAEVFNNYGPKPNSSLILGYGFAIPDNPDDTIILKIGSNIDGAGSQASSGHEVGREANGAEAVWRDVRQIVAAGCVADENFEADFDMRSDPTLNIETDMETTETLTDMVSSLLHRLPVLPVEGAPPPSVRSEVVYMWKCYVQGQKDILEAFLKWLKSKEQEIIRKAEELGINIIREDSDDG